MMESGSKVRTFVKARAVRYGQMVPCTKVGGKITKQMAKEGSSMLMVMSMMVNGRMIRHMVMESIVI